VTLVVESQPPEAKSFTTRSRFRSLSEWAGWYRVPRETAVFRIPENKRARRVNILPAAFVRVAIYLSTRKLDDTVSSDGRGFRRHSQMHVMGSNSGEMFYGKLSRRDRGEGGGNGDCVGLQFNRRVNI